MSAVSALNLNLGLTNHMFQKTSDAKRQDSSVNEGLPLSWCKNNEQAAEKIGLPQWYCNLYKITLDNKMKMFQFDQDFLMLI